MTRKGAKWVQRCEVQHTCCSNSTGGMLSPYLPGRFLREIFGRLLSRGWTR